MGYRVEAGLGRRGRLAYRRMGDAIGPERAKLAASAVACGDVPPSPASDKAERVDLARARFSVAACVADLERAAAAHGLCYQQERLARGRRRIGLSGEAELAPEAVDPAGEALREHPADLGERALSTAQTTPVGDQKAEEDRCGLLVREHQRRKARARAQPVAAAQPRLTLDGDADVLEGNCVPADRPLTYAELAGGRAPVDDRAALEELEKREESGRRTRDVRDSNTAPDKN
jgi:hypothetical protein